MLSKSPSQHTCVHSGVVEGGNAVSLPCFVCVLIERQAASLITTCSQTDTMTDNSSSPPISKHSSSTSPTLSDPHIPPNCEQCHSSACRRFTTLWKSGSRRSAPGRAPTLFVFIFLTGMAFRLTAEYKLDLTLSATLKCVSEWRLMGRLKSHWFSWE